MSSNTKIINVLKDDKFKEILDLLKETPAKEIFLVLPKKSKAFKDEGSFATLSSEAKKQDKRVTLLSSSPEISHLANKYDLDVLISKTPKPKVVPARTLSLVEPDDEENSFDPEKSLEHEEEEINQDKKITEIDLNTEIEEDDDDVEDPEEEEESDHVDDDGYQAVTTAVRTRKNLAEILTADEGRSLKVSSRKERSTRLGLKKENGSMDALKSVWKKQNDNIWAGLDIKEPIKNFQKKLVTILAIASVIILGAIIYISVGSAKIEIKPHKESLQTKLKILASDRYSSVNTELNRIPGQVFNIEKTATQTFNATGERDVAQKARGKITIYNEYGSGPQVLIATTRLQSENGLIFRTLKSVTVPGSKVEGGKITPGKITVEVVADKPGPTYNISAGGFTIPAFKERGDSARYEKIYGRSEESMRGGALGKAKVVTETDYESARIAMEDKIQKDIQDSLKLQTAGLKIINPTSPVTPVLQSTAKIDEATDTFDMTITGSIKTVGFREDDVKNLIKSSLEETEALVVLPEKLDLTYGQAIINDANNVMEFFVDIKGSGYTPIDEDAISSELLGKDETEIKKYFSGLDSIDSARIILSPFWVSKVPKNPASLKIEIIYE